MLLLSIQDWGKGFDSDPLFNAIDYAVDTQDVVMHTSLLGMQQYMTRIGGQCTIESRPGEGTKVVATVYLATATS
jgi:signal transduction histidine kinase